MRLRRLDLVPFGRFEALSLELPAPEDGAPDLAVVYGENEAGKSTVFEAWLAFLFGLPLQTPYAYRFPRKELAVGARLDTSDGPLELRRTGRREGSLTDRDGNAISPHRLAGLLFGLDKESYKTRFSLNDEVLREGGARIAQAHGDLGQLLHAGASGLAGISEALASVEEGVADFHRKGARASRVATAKRRLAEIATALSETELSPARYDDLVADCTRLREIRDARRGEVAAARAALRLREAAEERQSLGARIGELQARLAEAPGGPSLPENAVARVAGAARTLETERARLRRAGQDRRTAEAALADLPEDRAGLAVAERLRGLEEQTDRKGASLRARAQTAESDLADRRAALAAERERLDALVRDLPGAQGRPPEDLVIPERLRERLRKAAEAVLEAERSLAADRRQLAEDEAALGEAVEAPAGVADLDAAVQARARSWPDLDRLTQEARDAGRAAEDAARGLPPGWPEIVAEGLPEPQRLDALVRAWDAAVSAAATAEEQARQARASLAEAETDRDRLAGAPDTVTDAAIAATRDARDSAWASHRAALDAATAEAFETAMREDDALRELHRAGHAARADLRACEAAVARARLAVDAAGKRLQAAAAGKKTAAGDVRDAARALGLPEDAPAAELRPRRDRLETAAAAAATAERLAADLQRAREAAAELDAALRRALAAAGGPAPEAPADLARAAERQLAALAARQKAHDAWRARADALGSLRERVAACARQRADAEAAHADAAAGTWLHARAPRACLEALGVLDALSARIESVRELEARVSAMEADLAAFGAAAAPIRDALNLPDATTPTALLMAAAERAQAARDRATARGEQREAIARADEMAASAEDAILEAEGEIGQVLIGQSVPDDAPPAQTVEALASRDRLRDQLADLDSRYRAAGARVDPAALAEEEKILDPARADTLSARVTEADQELSETHEALGAAEAMLASALSARESDDLRQERAAILDALRDEARDTLARHAGLMAARQALRRFRDTHRSRMLDATEDAFCRLTGGAWARLETRQEGAQERLIGIDATGRSATIDEMSTGTQGQLYLALRIAGYRAFVAEHGPLPFVADDVHETFDDARARAAMEMALEIGEVGQSLVFTHHRHIVEIARDLHPAVTVLELPPPDRDTRAA